MCGARPARVPSNPPSSHSEITSALPYAALTRRQFDRIVDFVSTGGYALRAYERYARLRPTGDGRLRLSHPRLAQQYRMNAGTIVEVADDQDSPGRAEEARRARPESHATRNPACRGR